MKKKLIIPNISKSKSILNLINYNDIDHHPWGFKDEFNKVRFKIAHNSKNIYLQYDVIESEIMAKFSKHNDPVYKDSCVEFFIAFEEDTSYYNFEFNCLGTCRLAWGKDRYGRQLLDTQTINLIKTKTKIKRISKNGLTMFNWKIFIKIPLEIFYFNTLNSFENVKAKANFYKCGDDLSKPHYITWNNIKSKEPDFHLKSFFGDIEFN